MTGPVNILLVDDHEENLLALEAILTDPGLRLVRAQSGAEALKAVLRQEFAVILMDVAMPGMDGLEATRRIRNLHLPQGRPWVVALTANAMQGDREICLAAGMDDYIRKPIKLSELASALRQARAIAAA